MKSRMSLLIAWLLILPLVLAACGGGPADNAEKFLQAIDDGDKEEAEKYLCDNPSDELANTLEEMENGEDFDVVDITCEEAGDDVKCEYGFGEDTPEDQTVIFEMEDDKVCAIKQVE